jgi:hypothetical protein
MFKLTRLLTSLLLVTGLPLAVAKSHSLTVSPRINSSSSLLSGEWLIVQKQKRVALVIGNAAYPEDSLKNPVNDAIDVAKALTDIGFDVTLLENADRRKIHDAVKNFNRRLSQGEIGLFYYAGHGVQVAGENYLIPVDAKLDSESDVDIYSYPLKAVINAMETANASVKIIILDACRNNLFLRSWGSTGRSLSSRGLAEVKRSGRGTLISYATAPGEVAGDSLGKGRNSPYTAHLLKYLKAPNLEIGLMFRRVRDDVLQATNDRQVPWVSESLVGEVYLNPQPIATPSLSPPKPTPQVTPPPPKPTPPVTIPPRPTPQSSPSPEIALVSSRGIDYTRLRDLLAQGKWQEADQETTNLLIRASNRQNEGWLRKEDVKNLSCEDLRTMDKLWVAYSQGKFGFSVQREIYQSLGGTSEYNYVIWSKFGDRVGWRVNEKWIYYDDITFDQKAMRGHLPYRAGGINRVGSVVEGWWEGRGGGFFLRNVPCEL